MKWINRWPQAADLDLPADTYQSLIENLSQPFDGCIQTAQQFWKQYGCVLIALDKQQPLNTSLFDDPTRFAIQQALQHPELRTPLSADYELRLTITSDEGSGLYLLLPLNSDQPTHHPKEQPDE